MKKEEVITKMSNKQKFLDYSKKEIRSALLNITDDSLTNDSLPTIQKEEETAGDMIVAGYALVFESPTSLFRTKDGTDYYEVIDRHALDNTDLTDVPFKYNHNDSCMVLARTRNHSLELVVDQKGLKIKANLAKTSTGKDLYELIKRGDIDKMSFGFLIDEDKYDPVTRTRRILSISKLTDVSAVSDPAYPQTSLYPVYRDYFSAQEEAYQKLLQQQKNEEERRFKMLLLRTYL